jgi:hypothetical protein
VQGTGAIRRRHDQRSLVAPGRAGIVLAQHQETRGVVRLVFDVLGQLGQLVTGSRRLTGDGRSAGFLSRFLGGLGVAADRDALRLRQHPVEPFVALRQRLGMRVDAGDCAEFAFPLDIRFWWMRSTTSPQIFSEVPSSRSMVRPTAPSVEFSTGTTA